MPTTREIVAKISLLKVRSTLMYVADPREAFFLGHRLTVVVAHLVEPRVVNLPTLLLTILFNHVVEDLLKIRVNGQICTLRTKSWMEKRKRGQKLSAYLATYLQVTVFLGLFRPT
ncbi:MAG: hypothetical protein OEY83_06625 [Candidatus Bathyarchaeota archaeon]|nr:hypothetical protein [Candidatus Bathyarchaeota archaeon]MDH5713594.1 hypothetical protein [Candidatus Bathyarchaeota archaeon]